MFINLSAHSIHVGTCNIGKLDTVDEINPLRLLDMHYYVRCVPIVYIINLKSCQRG